MCHGRPRKPVRGALAAAMRAIKVWRCNKAPVSCPQQPCSLQPILAARIGCKQQRCWGHETGALLHRQTLMARIAAARAPLTGFARLRLLPRPVITKLYSNGWQNLSRSRDQYGERVGFRFAWVPSLKLPAAAPAVNMQRRPPAPAVKMQRDFLTVAGSSCENAASVPEWGVHENYKGI